MPAVKRTWKPQSTRRTSMAYAAPHTMTIAPTGRTDTLRRPCSRWDRIAANLAALRLARRDAIGRTHRMHRRDDAASLGRPAVLVLAGAGNGSARRHDRHVVCPMHECVHRTAFASRTANVIIGWIAGVLSFYNSTYYRHYHSWHHRYTQDPTRDPELMFPKVRNYVEYITSRPPGSAAASASSRRARRCRMCGIGGICGRRRCGRPSWSARSRPNAGSCA